MRILVVEDERDLNNVIAKKLTLDGYSVDSCFNGIDALDYIEMSEYDAVVLDIMLPKLNGLGVLERLRAKNNITPILLLTAKDSIEDKGMQVEVKTSDSMDLNWSSSNPKLLTYHSAKGLQFEAVFLPDCESIRLGNNNALYVAMTRTYQSLFIMYSGQFPSIFSEIPKDLFETSLASKPTVEL